VHCGSHCGSGHRLGRIEGHHRATWTPHHCAAFAQHDKIRSQVQVDLALLTLPVKAVVQGDQLGAWLLDAVRPLGIGAIGKDTCAAA
jgi:hypothetical protein